MEVRRSHRWRKSISARLDGDTLLVFVPAGLTRVEEDRWVSRMVEKMEAKLRRSRPSDAELVDRARALAAKYLPDGVRIGSVSWSDRQQRLWGSCSIDTADIRLSTRLQGLPSWVVDYVLLHELTHTILHEHNEQFWTLLAAYPRTERARGFLEGIEHMGRQLSGGEDEDAVADRTPCADEPG